MDEEWELVSLENSNFLHLEQERLEELVMNFEVLSVI